jgi:hypothetical protein
MALKTLFLRETGITLKNYTLGLREGWLIFQQGFLGGNKNKFLDDWSL